MSHRNAALTPVQRLRIGRLIVDDGWPTAHAAVYFHVSWPTAKQLSSQSADLTLDADASTRTIGRVHEL